MGKAKKDVFKEGIDTYAINLLWINREKKVDQKYIHKADTEEKLIDELFRPAVKWAKSNPEADINIWYDSKGNSEQALANTQSVLDKTLATSSLTNVKLRDLREIEFVKANEFLFDDGMPIYYRADLLKLITSLHIFQSEAKDAVVFSDLDVGDFTDRVNSIRMNKSELFDADTMSKIEECGSISTDNQFIQFINDEAAVAALRHIINSSAFIGTNAANVDFNTIEKDHFFVSKKYIMPTLFNVPFMQTTGWLAKFYQSIKYNNLGDCKIKVKASFMGLGNEDELIDYNPDTHGYAPMGNWINKRDGYLGFVLDYSTKLVRKKLVFQGDCPDGYYFRETETHRGSDHTEYGFSGPTIGSEPFKLNFWEKELVEETANSNSSEL